MQPVIRFDLREIEHFFREYAPDTTPVIRQGQDVALDEMGDIIKSRTEAYILDKARPHDGNVRVEVTVSADALPIPVSATIRANVTEDVRKELEEMLVRDLAIPKECQTWIGTH